RITHRPRTGRPPRRQLLVETGEVGVVDALRPLVASQAQQQVPGTRHPGIITRGGHTRVTTGRPPLPCPATDRQVHALVGVVDALGVAPVHVLPPVPAG